jgi:hypothetical protein
MNKDAIEEAENIKQRTQKENASMNLLDKLHEDLLTHEDLPRLKSINKGSIEVEMTK